MKRLSLASLALLVACGGGTTTDAGADLGAGTDSGVRIDSGAADSGPRTDSGTGTDSGAGADSGTGIDSGTGNDGGSCTAPGATGCAAGPACCGGLMCCAGVPYPAAGVCMASCPLNSNRFVKEGITPVDADDVLERVAQLPVARWSYSFDPAHAEHLGPMAQDFHATFACGTSDRTIDPIDEAGVSLAATQALYQRVEDLRAENAELGARIERLEARR